MSILRNKLTVYEGRNQLLEQEKSDLTETVNMLSAEVKSEPDGCNWTAFLAPPPTIK